MTGSIIRIEQESDQAEPGAARAAPRTEGP